MKFNTNYLQNISQINNKIEYLQNGIPVFMYEKSGSLSTSVGVFIKAGAYNENVKRRFGIAHVLEHMTFKSTMNMPTKKLNSAFSAYGAEVNAYTDYDTTAYYFSAPWCSSANVVKLFCDMLTAPKFDQKELDTEKGAIISEMQMYNDDPYSQATSELQKAFYKKCNRFGIDIIGLQESVKDLKSEDLFDFKEEYYGSNNICIVIVGNLSQRFEILKLLQNTFGILNTCNQTYHEKLLATRKKEYYDFNVNCEQCHIIGKSHIQLNKSCRNKTIAEIEVLSKIFGKLRLFDEIREKRGMAYSAYSYYSLIGSSDCSFNWYIGTQHDLKKKALICLEKIKDELINMPVNDNMLILAKSALIGDILMQYDSNHSLMNTIGLEWIHANEMYNINTEINQIYAITAADVKSLAIKLFNKAPSMTLVTYKDK